MEVIGEGTRHENMVSNKKGWREKIRVINPKKI